MIDKKIEYFIQVVENGSFSSAAKSLYISQPALSKQIALLEKELDITLFDRHHYRPTLTSEGQYFYDEIIKLTESYQDILNHLKEVKHKTIRIGITGAYENKEFMNAIKVIKNKYQNIDISFIKCNFNESSLKLLNNDLDICLGIESTFKNINTINYDILYHYHMCVICSFDHPLAIYNEITPSMIKDEPMILLSKDFGKNMYNDFMKSCEEDGFKPNIKKVVNSFDGLIFNVSIGEGIAIVSNNVVSPSEVKIIDLVNSHHSNNYVIAYHQYEEDNIIQSLIKDIKEYFKDYNLML